MTSSELSKWNEHNAAAQRTELERWSRAIQSGDHTLVTDAARRLADAKDKLDPEWIFTVTDKWWTHVGEAGAWVMEASGTDPRNNVATATMKQSCESPLIGHMMGCRETLVGVIVETAGLKFPFYVEKHNYKHDKGDQTSIATLRGIWDILNYLVIWPSWFLPIQAQPFSHAVYFAPIVTAIENMISECALRIQSGIWEFVNNALSLNPDMRAWFGTILQAIERDGFSIETFLTMLKTPMYVVRSNPFLDGSPLWGRTVRMETVGSVVTEATRPYGVSVDIELWEVGDEQPDQWANLTQPTYVVRVSDRSQIEGPTKTILDSAIRTTVDLFGSLFGEVEGILSHAQGMEGVFVAPIVGVNYTAPWVMLEAPAPGEKGGLLTCEIIDHTPKGWQHIVGGKSPKWLNDLINAWFSFVIDMAMIVIGFTGVPSNLLEGFLNDAFFAFQMLQLYDRRDRMGPYHPAIERFHATGAPPYNVETLFTFIKVIWESRGWTSVTATFRNGEIYTLGRDFFKGQLISLVYMNRTKMVTDYVENIMWRITDSDREVLVQIGDGRADEPSIAKMQRLITAGQEALNVWTLAPNS